MEKLYLCNPRKNTECKKTGCYFYKTNYRDLYNDCYTTKHKEYELKINEIVKEPIYREDRYGNCEKV